MDGSCRAPGIPGEREHEPVEGDLPKEPFDKLEASTERLERLPRDLLEARRSTGLMIPPVQKLQPYVLFVCPAIVSISIICIQLIIVFIFRCYSMPVNAELYNDIEFVLYKLSFVARCELMSKV